MKKIFFILTVTTILEMVLLFSVGNDYENVNNNIGYLLALIIALFLTLYNLFNFKNVKKKLKLTNLFLTTIIVLLIPILFFFTLPDFTYTEAKELVEKEENVQVINNEDNRVPDTRIEGPNEQRHYIIHAKNDEEIVRFIFNPYDGSYRTIIFED
ncbi:hypothetical protein BN1058_00678 [Paraliobacillus sp. PM-2]|uniref:hypothetical protein n=1 Tax=Paraliobacillus sp. PM-2 TaxID=1462524 RepID=UPI00061C88D6|nr:hypothetical protein [Paraliobacillus sp. PM-2]CQR46418.1 hypothetical protein BN1058_00678 [Paraliobacillus sp. PM-2]